MKKLDLLVFAFVTLLPQLALSSGAAANCEDKIFNATLGLFNSRVTTGASATIIQIQNGKQNTVLTAFTDKHVIHGACPGISPGKTCRASVFAEPHGCKGYRGQASVTLISHSGANGEDAAIVEITLPNSVDALKCLTSLETAPIAPVGEPVLRVGYGHFNKSLRSGTIAGYVDYGKIINYPGEPSAKLASAMNIQPGDCGGPVASAHSCRLYAMSQIGPIRGKSLDIISIYYDELRRGVDISRTQVTQRVPMEEVDTVLDRYLPKAQLQDATVEPWDGRLMPGESIAPDLLWQSNRPAQN